MEAIATFPEEDFEDGPRHFRMAQRSGAQRAMVQSARIAARTSRFLSPGALERRHGWNGVKWSNIQALKTCLSRSKLNKWGNIVMTPASYGHAAYQSRIFRWLILSGSGEGFPQRAPSRLPRASEWPMSPGEARLSIRSTDHKNFRSPNPGNVVECCPHRTAPPRWKIRGSFISKSGQENFGFAANTGICAFSILTGNWKNGLFPYFPGHIDIALREQQGYFA